MKVKWVLVIIATLMLSACGGGAPDKVEIAEVTFAKGLSENMEAVDPTSTFLPNETVAVSVRVPGRPKEGVLGAKFMFKDQLIAETSVDFGQENSGLLFSVGQDSFAGFTLTHEQPLLISPYYTVDLTLDGSPLESYSFTVLPPADAIPTVVNQTVFAAGVSEGIEPVDIKDVFAPTETVYFIGAGDFGRLSNLQTDWYVNGDQLVEDCTSYAVLDRNLPDDRFYFNCGITSGWPAGTHKVVLTIDDVPVMEKSFSVQ